MKTCMIGFIVFSLFHPISNYEVKQILHLAGGTAEDHHGYQGCCISLKVSFAYKMQHCEATLCLLSLKNK